MTALLPLLLAIAASAAVPYELKPATKVRGVVWGFDFLPDGRAILTTREGNIWLHDPKTGKDEPVAGAPKVWARGQGGLLDVRVHPGFAKNALVYLTWSQPTGDGAATALGRARLEGAALKGLETLLLTNAGGGEGHHFGSRVEFDGRYLFMTVGERGQRDLAQDLRRHNGKILRLTHDGKPAGAGIPGALPEIWSYGHRNPQGLGLQPGANRLWSVEFGPRGGDELNAVEKGGNYGWPVITYGREYYGPKIGTTHKEGMEQPAVYWTPVISPSGMAFYDGASFPSWRGSIFIACLSGEHIRRVVLDGDKVVEQESLLEDKGWRIRHVRQGPDGNLWFSTDDGRLGRLVPKA